MLQQSSSPSDFAEQLWRRFTAVPKGAPHVASYDPGPVGRPISRGFEGLKIVADVGITPTDSVNFGWKFAEPTDIALGSTPVGPVRFPIRLPERLRWTHLYIIGQPGMGKTALLANICLQDLRAGRGFAVMTPDPELLVRHLLPLCAEHDDVVYINPRDTSCPVPFNPLHLEPGEDLHTKVADTLQAFHELFDELGPGGARMEAILREAFYTLMQRPGSTLFDLERLLDRNDDRFRESVLDQVPDERARTFWRSTYLSFPKDAHNPIITRLNALLRPEFVAAMLCTPGRCLSVRQAMDKGTVLLFNLTNQLGEENARRLGQLIVVKFQQAALSREDIESEEQRRPYYLLLDEFQTFCAASAQAYGTLLERARKYRLGLTLAHQELGQLDEHIVRRIIGTVPSRVILRLGETDAPRLARALLQYEPEERSFFGHLEKPARIVRTDPHRLQTLRQFTAYCRMGLASFFLPTLTYDDLPALPREEAAARRNLTIERSRSRFATASATPPRPAEEEPDVPPASPFDGVDPRDVL